MDAPIREELFVKKDYSETIINWFMAIAMVLCVMCLFKLTAVLLMTPISQLKL